MKITFEDQEYTFNLDDISVAQAKVIKVHCGLTMLGLDQGMRELDVDAMRAAYWLMHAQSGIPCDIDRADFKLVKFSEAIIAAIVAEHPELAPTDDEEAPKDE